MKVYLKLSTNRFAERTRLNGYTYMKQSLVQAHCLLLNHENSPGMPFAYNRQYASQKLQEKVQPRLEVPVASF